ncbi:MAG: hypothetical protein WH035_01365 [Spirochaetota bacterium]
MKECIKFIDLTHSSIEKQIPSFLDLLNFQIKRVLALAGGIKLDYEYWNEKDWLNKPYYYKCKLNLIKKLVPKLFGDIFLFFLKTKKGQS